MTVQFRRQQAVEFLEGRLVHRDIEIVAGHLVERLASGLGAFSFPLSLQGHVGNTGHEELGHAGLGMIWILEHDSEPDPLAVTRGHVKRDLPTLGEVQFTWTRLDVAPVQPDVPPVRRASRSDPRNTSPGTPPACAEASSRQTGRPSVPCRSWGRSSGDGVVVMTTLLPGTQSSGRYCGNGPW